MNMLSRKENMMPAVSVVDDAKVWLDLMIKRGHKERFSVVVTLTPELANAMLEHNNANRSFSKAAMLRLAQSIKAGEWIVTTEGLAFDMAGDLQNGQHRCQAVVYTGISIATLIWFGSSPAEYDFLDQPRVRNASNLIERVGMNFPNQRTRIVRLLHNTNTNTFQKLSPATVKERCRELDCAAMDEALAAGGKSKNVLSHAEGAFVYYVISQASKQADCLPSFWEQLSFGTDISQNNPVGPVRDKLLLKASFGWTDSTLRSVARANSIISAWNAWVPVKPSRFVANFQDGLKLQAIR